MSDMIMKQPDGGYHVADASNLTKKDCDELIELRIKSQKKFKIDSLNVSNACSIALFEHYKKNY